MKSYNTVYYLLTVLLIMGGFASMAQNSYGMPIISAVCMAFGLIFFVQFIQALRANEPNRTEQAIEFFALFVLAFIFTLRTLQIYFPFIEWIFVAAAVGTCPELFYPASALVSPDQPEKQNTRQAHPDCLSEHCAFLYCHGGDYFQTTDCPMDRGPRIVPGFCFSPGRSVQKTFFTGRRKQVRLFHHRRI